jgi:PqqD family protein of HPr-rel-A system
MLQRTVIRWTRGAAVVFDRATWRTHLLNESAASVLAFLAKQHALEKLSLDEAHRLLEDADRPSIPPDQLDQLLDQLVELGVLQA